MSKPNKQIYFNEPQRLTQLIGANISVIVAERRTGKTEENLLEHRTDGTDAFDTLYIGCEKFPQRNFYPISTNGVL